ncbi:glutathione-S-transferase theta, GST [Xylariales sp. PMI_506]|nr:glutathione-S-transferase theta, GST [Xylariales sp. PMI_506]
MGFTVYGYENNPRTRLVRIIAAAQEIHLDQVEVIPRMEMNRDLLIREFPMSSGKIPALEGPGVKLTETLAISVYLAKMNPGTSLLGDGSPEEEAQVIAWMSWANQELLMTLAKWFLPLIPKFSRPAPYDEKAVAAGKTASLFMLNALEDMLYGRTTLVGDRVTLADFFVAIVLSRGLEWVLDASWRSSHPNCMKHFNMVRELPAVRSVVPDFILVDVETPNANPYNG